MQSFHFSTLLQAFCLELGQLKANNGGGGGKQKTNAETCAYEQILQDGEEKKNGIQYCTPIQSDGEYKEHESFRVPMSKACMFKVARAKV